MTTTPTLATRLRQFADAGKYCDVTLRSSSADDDERRFACHKVVLLARGLLRSDLATSDDQLRDDVSEVTVDCSSRGLGHVVKFAYSDDDELPAIDERNVFHCLQASRVLSVKQIEDKCVGWLRTSMSWFLPVGGAFHHLDHFASLMTTLEHHRDLVTSTKSDVTIESDSLTKVGEELEGAYRTACLMTLDYVAVDAEKVPSVAVVEPSVEEPTPVEEASNPFGDEEEEGETPEAAVVAPEPKARTSSNPFGDEEREEETKSSETLTNPFGEEFEEEKKEAPAETKPFNPFGEEEEEDVVDDIQPSTPAPPKPKARSRSALASTNSNELPVPTPPPRRPSSPAPRKKAAPKPPSPAPSKKDTAVKQETPAKPAAPKATSSSSKGSSLSLKNATFPKMKSLSKVLKSKSGDKEKSSTLGKTPTATTTTAATTGKTPPPRPKPPTIVKKSASKEKEESSNPFE